MESLRLVTRFEDEYFVEAVVVAMLRGPRHGILDSAYHAGLSPTAAGGSPLRERQGYDSRTCVRAKVYVGMSYFPGNVKNSQSLHARPGVGNDFARFAFSAWSILTAREPDQQLVATQSK